MPHKIDTKTVTRRLSAAELAEYGPLFMNAKRLLALVSELQGLTLAIVEGRADPNGQTPPSSPPADSSL